MTSKPAWLRAHERPWRRGAVYDNIQEAALAGDIQDMLTVAMPLKAYHMAREGHLPSALARAMIGD
jgi:hypothetical protein